MIKFGIMQGRLSTPSSGKIQEFPEKWEKEFPLMEKIGVDYIDWIITRDTGKYNPILNLPFLHKIGSVCMDNVVDENFFTSDLFRKDLLKICKDLYSIGYRSITIPLLEESSIFKSDKKYKIAHDFLIGLSACAPEMLVHIEMEQIDENSISLLDISDNFYFVYDTGNLTSFYTKDEQLDILEMNLKRIRIIHLKDKLNGITVRPGEGDVTFVDIFSILKKTVEKINLTIQTSRGKDGEEELTINKDLQFFKQKIYEQNF